MTKNIITDVWGKADTLNLVYSLDSDGLWTVNVPPDLSDGCYAAEIWAKNLCGEVGYWSGFLYMHQGRARLYLESKKYSLWLMPSQMVLSGDMPIEIHLERSCRHAQSDF